MRGLARLLAEVAYPELYSLIAGSALFCEDRTAAARVLSALAPDERALLALFALDQRVPRSMCTEPLLRVADLLVEAGLANDDGGIRLDDLVVVPTLGGHLLTAAPKDWRPQSARRGRAYLGPDSLRLARVLPDATGRTVLDVGAGCGIQGVLAARGARRVVLTDIEPLSVELAQLNAVLNGVDGAISRMGDGYAPAVGERFDLIVALPPYVPAVPGADDTVISGGHDGLRLIRRLLEGADEHLSDDGELVLFAQLLCDDRGPLLAHLGDAVAADSSCRITCSEWHPLFPYVAELSQRLAAAEALPLDAVRTALLRSLREQEVTGVCAGFVRLRRHRSPFGSPGITVTGFSPGRGTDLLIPPTGITFSAQAGITLAQRSGTDEREAFPPTVAALLAAFDGRRDVAQAMEAAWGRPPGADPRDLLDQALHHVATLERGGWLRRVAGPL